MGGYAGGYAVGQALQGYKDADQAHERKKYDDKRMKALELNNTSVALSNKVRKDNFDQMVKVREHLASKNYSPEQIAMWEAEKTEAQKEEALLNLNMKQDHQAIVTLMRRLSPAATADEAGQLISSTMTQASLGGAYGYDVGEDNVLYIESDSDPNRRIPISPGEDGSYYEAAQSMLERMLDPIKYRQVERQDRLKKMEYEYKKIMAGAKDARGQREHQAKMAWYAVQYANALNKSGGKDGGTFDKIEDTLEFYDNQMKALEGQIEGMELDSLPSIDKDGGEVSYSIYERMKAASEGSNPDVAEIARSWLTLRNHRQTKYDEFMHRIDPSIANDTALRAEHAQLSAQFGKETADRVMGTKIRHMMATDNYKGAGKTVQALKDRSDKDRQKKYNDEQNVPKRAMPTPDDDPVITARSNALKM